MNEGERGSVSCGAQQAEGGAAKGREAAGAHHVHRGVGHPPEVLGGRLQELSARVVHAPKKPARHRDTMQILR